MRTLLEEEYSEVSVRDLHSVEGYDDFLSRYAHVKPNCDKHFNAYRWDACRFAHKAFAIIDAFWECDSGLDRDAHFWWLDADVEFTKDVPVELLEGLISTHTCAYLGRRGSYTETGVIGFNVDHPYSYDMMVAYEDQYLNGRIFHNHMWTDCQAFDASLLGGRNMSPSAEGMNNALEVSPLAAYMRHHKGPQKNKGVE